MASTSYPDYPSTVARRPEAERAFRLARRRFVAAERLDMRALSAELGVDRSTLFRWVGNRDQLIAAILLSLSAPAIEDADERARADGADSGGRRIAMTAYHYSDVMIESPFFQAYLHRESDRALRLLTSKASPVQAYVVGIFERMVERECDRGHLRHALGPHDLAYLIVRIIESFIYADIITGETPDAAKIRDAVAALLHTEV